MAAAALLHIMQIELEITSERKNVLQPSVRKQMESFYFLCGAFGSESPRDTRLYSKSSVHRRKSDAQVIS
jgi:hypothetical protein